MPAPGAHMTSRGIERCLPPVAKTQPHSTGANAGLSPRTASERSASNRHVNAVRHLASRSLSQCPATRGLDISARRENLLQP